MMPSVADRHQSGTSRTDREEINTLRRIEVLLERIAFQLEELNRKADEMETE